MILYVLRATQADLTQSKNAHNNQFRSRAFGGQPTLKYKPVLETYEGI